MPYTPTVQDRTGEFLMRGITGAADNLSEAMKQRKQQSQKAASLRKTIGIYNPELKDEVQTMGLADLEGYVAGLGMKAAKDKLAQEQADKERDFNLSKAYFDLQQQLAAQAAAREAAGQRFTQGLAARATAGGAPSMDFANTLAGEPQPARDVGLADIVQAAGQSGLALDPERLAPLLRADNLGQRGGRPAPEEPRTVTLDDGTKVMWNPTTGKSEVLRDQPDANMVPARERLGAIKAKLAALTKQGRPLTDPKAQAAYDAKLEALFSQLDGFSGGGNPAADAVVGGGNSAFESELNDLLKRKR